MKPLVSLNWNAPRIRMKNKKIGIIGGGMMGLTLALRLAERGNRVTVLEAGPSLGGLASPWQLDDIVWDRFYHVISLSDLALRGILEEIGVADSIRWVETKAGFYSGGKFYSMSNAVEFLRFPPLSLIEKFRLGTTIFFGSKIRDGKRLESIPVETWLRKWSGQGTYEKIWRPLLKAKLGAAYERVSAFFIWAYIRRMYQARQSGLKKEMFGYVPGGYARIITAFEQRLRQLNVECRTSCAVQNIGKTGEHIEVTHANHDVETFDRVILTVPSPVIPKLCPELSTEELDGYRACEYLGVVCSSILLRRNLGPYYVTNITDEWVPLTGVINFSTILPPEEISGRFLVYLPKYVLASDDEAFAESDDAIRERLLGVLERMYPDFNRTDVVAFQTARARNVMALPTLNYSEQIPPAKTSIPGVFVVNSAQITKGVLNINETIEVALDALGCLLEE